MSCSACNEPVEEGAKTMDAPCCDRKYHSACGIQQIGMAIFHFAAATCACGGLLYQYPTHQTPENTAELSQARIAAARAATGAAAELKALKTKGTLVQKSLTAYKKYIAEKNTEYRANIDQYVSAIQAVRENVCTEVKASEPYKAYRRLKSSQRTLQMHFQKKHSLTRYDMRIMCGLQRFYRWKYTPISLLEKKIRLRL